MKSTKFSTINQFPIHRQKSMLNPWCDWACFKGRDAEFVGSHDTDHFQKNTATNLLPAPGSSSTKQIDTRSNYYSHQEESDADAKAVKDAIAASLKTASEEKKLEQLLRMTEQEEIAIAISSASVQSKSEDSLRKIEQEELQLALALSQSQCQPKSKNPFSFFK